MSIWFRIGELVSRASPSVFDVVEAVRTFFAGDPQLRRKVAFSIAMIALSAKMAKADGVVTQDEVRAFQQIFAVPADEARNVARLYEIANKDIAGYEAYAEQMARDVRIGPRELRDARRRSSTGCSISPRPMACCMSARAISSGASPRSSRSTKRTTTASWPATSIWAPPIPTSCSALNAALPFDEVRRRYRRLVADNHPDRLIARGVPEEFIAIATTRLAAINAAYELIERGLRAA